MSEASNPSPARILVIFGTRPEAIKLGTSINPVI